jgi:DNA-binding SARP family transcriptional activator/Tfp pilus assembly protein PilF
MIRLRTLGALDLRAAGGEELRAVLAQPRRVALLAYLTLATPRGPQRRDRILALFWPELDVDHARNALGQALHFLRRSMGPAAIVNRNGDGLAVDQAQVWCDAAAFEEALDTDRTGEALALYRGDLLEGFHIDDAPEFERWLESERVRLAARYTKAVEALASDREGAGDFEGAATYWQVLTARDPYSSRMTLRLMRALTAAGDPAGALAQARQHEQLLREELAIAPDAEVAAFVRRLRAERPEQSLSPPKPEARHAAGEASPQAERLVEPEPQLQQRPSRTGRRRAFLPMGLLAAGVIGVAAMLTVRIGAEPSGSAPIVQLTARDADPDQTYLRDMYVRGRNAERSRSEVGLATAREAYERAIRRDSTFAPAYAGLVAVYGAGAHYGYMELRPALDSARLMARRAVALDSSLSTTRAAYAVTLADAGDFVAAEREFRRAIELDSTDVLAHQWYAVLLVALGRAEEGQREARLAARLDPLVSRGHAAMQRYAHWLLTGTRPHLQMPVRERRPWLKDEPGDPWPHARQAEELAQAGECAAARKDLDRALRLNADNVRMRPEIARVDWWCGERTRARALLDDMKRRPDARDNAFHVAQLHTLFGEKDSAFVWLDRHERWMVIELAMLSALHHMDPLRSDSRYLRLQKRLGMRK